MGKSPLVRRYKILLTVYLVSVILGSFFWLGLSFYILAYFGFI